MWWFCHGSQSQSRAAGFPTVFAFLQEEVKHHRDDVLRFLCVDAGMASAMAATVVRVFLQPDALRMYVAAFHD